MLLELSHCHQPKYNTYFILTGKTLPAGKQYWSKLAKHKFWCSARRYWNSSKNVDDQHQWDIEVFWSQRSPWKKWQGSAAKKDLSVWHPSWYWAFCLTEAGESQIGWVPEKDEANLNAIENALHLPNFRAKINRASAKKKTGRQIYKNNNFYSL